MVLSETERKKTVEALLLQKVFNTTPDAIIISRIADERRIDFNEGFLRLTGYSREEVEGRTSLELNLWENPNDRKKYLATMKEKGRVHEQEARFVMKSGKIRDGLVSGETFHVGDDLYMFTIVRDVTERKRVEKEISLVNRALRMLSDTNHALFHISDEVMLLNEVCRIIVDVGGYCMAWVGFAGHDKAKTLHPAGHAGFKAGYIESANVIREENEGGPSPGITAIRTGQPSIAQNILLDPAFAPWRDAAIRHGYKSVLALPLISECQTLGALSIYSIETDAFSTKELEILRELAGDLAFGITVLRDRAEHKKTEEGVRYQATLLANVNDAIVASDENYKLTAWNAAAESLYGWKAEEVLGRSGLEIVQTDYLDADKDEMLRTIAAAGRWRGEVTQVRRDGTRIPVEVSSIVLHDKNGRIAGYVSVNRDITQRKSVEKDLAERVMLAEMSADIGYSLTTKDDLRSILAEVAKALVQHLDVAFVRIWTFNAAENVLELQASAGMYTRIDGSHSRVPVGKFKIGLIAEKRKPHFTNAVIGDPLVHDQEWAKRERMVAFAGHPLTIQDKLIGVMAMFSRKPITDITLKALASVSNEIAIGIERKQVEKELENHRNHLEELVKERTVELNNKNEELTNSKLALISLIDELNKTTEELVKARDHAEAADRLKSIFLATMSHELRTPLNSIIGFTGILLQGFSGSLNEEQNKQLNMVKSSANHLMSLINDVLDISKIEAGQLKINIAPFNMNRSIETVIRIVTPLAEKNGLKLHVETASDPGVIVSDKRRVEQIIFNLLSNAIKFTEKGEVKIECQISGDQVITRIIDTGIGIKPESMDKLFKPFVQIENGLSRRYEGTGLGLSICKRLVEMLGGTINAQSQYGKGSVFTFTLPIKVRL